MAIFVGFFGLIKERKGIFEHSKSYFNSIGYNQCLCYESELLDVYLYGFKNKEEFNFFIKNDVFFLWDGYFIEDGKSLQENIYCLWEKKGLDLLEKLEGSFSIVFGDLKEKKIFLAKDIFGSRSLFFAFKKNCLIWSNHLNSLKYFRGIFDLSINFQSLHDYTSLFFIPSPYTLYKEINSLMPAEILQARLLNGDEIDIQKRKYYIWKIENNFLKSKTQCIQRAEPLLEESVKDVLKVGNNFASLLSGGIDSSLVSYYSAKNLKSKLRTFNVKFFEEKYDETWAAKEVAKRIESIHTTYEIKKEELQLNKILEILQFAGQPFGDSSLIPLSLVCEYIRSYSENLLIGEGGDEGFWINPYVLKLAYFNTLPSFFKKILFNFSKNIGLIKSSIEYDNLESPTKIMSTVYSWIREKEHKSLMPIKGLLPVERYFQPEWQYELNLMKDKKNYLCFLGTEALLRFNLPNDYLFKIEVAEKMKKINIFNPLLNKKLIEFSLKIPPPFKKNKIILRKIAANYFEKKIYSKPKWGFGFPLDVYLVGKVKEEINELISSKSNELSNYFCKEVYQKWVEAFCKGKFVENVSRMGLYQRIFMLLSLSLFL